MKFNRELSIAAAVALVAVAGIVWYEATRMAAAPDVLVYKTPTCGCCGKWADHLVAAGFDVTTQDVDDLEAIKREHGVRPEFDSCHTALVGGYVIEGHVPADVIRRLLEERPEVVGLTVPGMPIGSPGMEVAGRPDEPYDILSFDREGNLDLYAHRGGPQTGSRRHRPK